MRYPSAWSFDLDPHFIYLRLCLHVSQDDGCFLKHDDVSSTSLLNVSVSDEKHVSSACLTCAWALIIILPASRTTTMKDETSSPMLLAVAMVIRNQTPELKRAKVSTSKAHIIFWCAFFSTFRPSPFFNNGLLCRHPNDALSISHAWRLTDILHIGLGYCVTAPYSRIRWFMSRA